MDLPKNERTFEVSETGATTGKSYEGKFTVKCILNMFDKRQLEMEKTRLMADYSNPTDGLSGIAFILANLRVRVIDSPEWWKQSAGGDDIYDEDVLVKLYDKAMEAEKEWRDELKGKAEGNSKTESEPTNSPS